MALHLERDGKTFTEVEHARILARALQHAGPSTGQTLQEQRGVLVPAVLRPEQGEDGELEVVRLALEQGDDAIELPVREAELAVNWRFRDGAQAVSLPAGSAALGCRGGLSGCFSVTRQRRPSGPHAVAPHGYGRRRVPPRRRSPAPPAAIWGSSFMWIRLGVDELEPSVVVLCRTASGRWCCSHSSSVAAGCGRSVTPWCR